MTDYLIAHNSSGNRSATLAFSRINSVLACWWSA